MDSSPGFYNKDFRQFVETEIRATRCPSGQSGLMETNFFAKVNCKNCDKFLFRDFPATLFNLTDIIYSSDTMSPDAILVIPHLSKELNLIGLPKLPYTLKKAKTKSSSKFSEDPLEITFNSKSMIEALTTICCDLVKKVKTMGEIDDSAYDKLNFENSKLEKQLKLNKLETEKVLTDLNKTKKVNQQLQEKVDHLQMKLKDYEVELLKVTKRNQTNEDVLKHALKKKQSDLFELHKAVWKQFNMADENYFPENFKLVQLNQPDFSKLWSTVKYNDPITAEDALKKALGIFQRNNKGLLEENYSLKISFLTVLQELHDVLKIMVDKLHIPASTLTNFKVSDIFDDIEIFNMSVYTNILQKHFKVIKRVCELFEDSSFTVADDMFVCWSNVINSL